MSGSYGFQQLEWNEEKDPKSYPLWLNDLAHVPTPWKPLSVIHWLSAVQVGMRLAAAKISLPHSYGTDVRVKDGHYWTAARKAKPEEVPEREKAYRKYVQPLIEDFDKEWNKAMAEWYPIVEGFKERCHPQQLKELNDVELFELLEDYELHCHRRCWVDYFVWLDVVMDLYNLFADLCRQETGIGIEDPVFKKLLRGFDTIEFRINRELWRLGDRAKELAIDQLFLTTEDDEKLMSRLQASDAGRKWLEEYGEFLNAYGWRCSGWTDLGTPSWIEKPSEGLRHIKGGIAKGGPHAADIERESLVKQREEAEREILAKVSSRQKDWFAKLMKLAMKSSWFSEEHAIYTAVLDTAIARHIFMEYGRRFAEAGVIDSKEDILFLLVPEIMKETIPPGGVDLRPYVNKHREEWEKNLKMEPQPFIGDISYLAEECRWDPLVKIVVAPPIVRPELKADLYGSSSSHGVVEGIAHVILNEEELGQLKPGEILVTVITNAMWTPAFAIISFTFWLFRSYSNFGN